MRQFAINLAQQADEYELNHFVGGTFHGFCLAIAVMADVTASCVEETICELAGVES